MNNSNNLNDQFFNQLASLQTATLHEVLGKKGAIDSHIKPLDANMKVCGPAMTVKCHVGDNLTIHHALSKVKKGEIMVVDCGGYTEAGAWGEINTTQALQRGVGGLVMDGSVRDVESICKLNFPVFTKGVSIKGTVKKTLGDINNTIVCGGVMVNPGDVILGDRDGVVVIPKEKAKEAYQKARDKERKEEEIMDRIRQGELTVDILGFRDIIEKELSS